MAPQKKSIITEDVAIMTVFVDYLAKINQFQTKVISRNGQSNWKECGRKKNLYS
jgi:hypothetical protein